MSYLFNNWNNVKPKDKKKLRKSIYRNLLKMDICTMFEYKGVPENINPIFIEDILFFNGTIGWYKSGDTMICFPGGHSGEVDIFGLGTEYTGATPQGDINGVIGETIVVGYNNNSMTPESLNVMRYSDIFTEIDTSLDSNLINSRFHKMPVANDKKGKTQLETALQNIIDGKPQSVTSSNILNEDLNGKTFDVLEITDGNSSDKIQYLYQFREYMKKDFFNHYGQAMQTTNKLAQTNSDEIHGEDSTSFIYAYNRLKQRKEMCERINELFDLNMSVDFAPPWKVEYKKFLETAENENENLAKSKEDEPISKDDSDVEKGEDGNE